MTPELPLHGTQSLWCVRVGERNWRQRRFLYFAGRERKDYTDKKTITINEKLYTQEVRGPTELIYQGNLPAQ